MTMWESGNGRLSVDSEHRECYFDSKKECIKEMMKHQPFGWIQDKYYDCVFQITIIDDDGIYVSDFEEGTIAYDFAEALKQFEFLDGSIFGVITE